MGDLSSLEAKVGILGVGAMGSALARGMVKAGYSADRLWLSDVHRERVASVASELGAHLADDGVALSREVEVLVLAVKPSTVEPALAPISAGAGRFGSLISIAAGVRLDRLQFLVGRPVAIVRAMPNNPAQVLSGACALCGNPLASEAILAQAEAIFRACGTVVRVEEDQLDAVTALSGSGPAYVYLMIEALIDGGVKAGLPRAIAHDLATQTVLGAARMVIETGRHPAELKDLVATPSGTTIEALALLEQNGVRSALIEAIGAATARSRALGAAKPL